MKNEIQIDNLLHYIQHYNGCSELTLINHFGEDIQNLLQILIQNGLIQKRYWHWENSELSKPIYKIL